MNIHIDKSTWAQFFQNSTITDCSVRDRDIIYVCLRRNVEAEDASMMWDSEISTVFFAIYLDTANENFTALPITNISKPRVGVSTVPAAHGLLVAQNFSGHVVVMGANSPPQEAIHQDGFPMPQRIKTIFGYAYSVGSRRKIYKRSEVGKWEKLSGFPEGGDVAEVGFKDLDAFAENDMYAVGGHGDIWHFDGNTWAQKGFPSNVTLGTVTCAGDGNVYITGEGGSIWVGRDSTWKQIYKGGSTILWNDALWFEGQLWLASDYQFRVWNGQALEMPQGPGGEPILMSGHMDVRDGLLAIASTDGVMTFDGKEWRVIVAPYE